MATPESHIESMKSIAQSLSQEPGVRTAYIDDWGRYSNFTLVVVPDVWDRATTNRLKGTVRRALRGSEFHLRACFPPEYVGKDFLGLRRYHRDDWHFDIDAQLYDAETNSFAADH